MNTEKDKSIALLISRMQEKRDNLLFELEKVQKWLNQIDIFIGQGKDIVGDVEKAISGEISAPLPECPAQTNIKVEPPENKIDRIMRLMGDKSDTETSHPEKIRQILEESGGPLSMSQIHNQFLARNWPIKSGRPRQIIYNTLIRRDDWFVKLGDRLWGLKGRDDIEPNLETA